MPRPNLLRLFASLPLPTADNAAGRFSARPVPGIPCCSIGKTVTGLPVLLIETDASGPRGSIAPIVLENLSVLHNVDCRLSDGNVSSVHRLSVIRCCGEEPLLHEYFLRTLTPIIESLPQRPSRERVVAAVATLIELFRSASQPARKTIQGLWAELFVILVSPDPAILLRCWHTEPENRFDLANMRSESM